MSGVSKKLPAQHLRAGATDEESRDAAPPRNAAPHERAMSDDRGTAMRHEDTGGAAQRSAQEWTPNSWTSRMEPHQFVYPDRDAVARAVAKLRALPPLVTSWEIERLKSQLAEAEQGKRFVLQGGDCAEALDECRPETITNKLKILIQMSLVLAFGLQRPVTRLGRFAGQYAKPRSSREETRTLESGEAITLPSYFGDLVNRAEFTPEARRPDPHLMVRGYQHAAMTLNFIRALIDGGFADLHHPEYWDLGWMGSAGLSAEQRAEYEKMTWSISQGLRLMETIGEKSVEESTRVEFFTSHEGLNLLYESASTRQVPRRSGWYNLATHLPWLGERTRSLEGAHVEYFRGIENPVGVKVGPKATPDEVVALSRVLNPRNEPGKLVLISRLGRGRAADALPPLVGAMRDASRRCLWVCDPMHGNTRSTPSGLKTRRFDDILAELKEVVDAHEASGSRLGGVHLELTGEAVTECVGGAEGLTEEGLVTNYVSRCDPRLNYQQALEVAFVLAHRLDGH